MLMLIILAGVLLKHHIPWCFIDVGCPSKQTTVKGHVQTDIWTQHGTILSSDGCRTVHRRTPCKIIHICVLVVGRVLENGERKKKNPHGHMKTVKNQSESNPSSRWNLDPGAVHGSFYILLSSFVLIYHCGCFLLGTEMPLKAKSSIKLGKLSRRWRTLETLRR